MVYFLDCDKKSLTKFKLLYNIDCSLINFHDGIVYSVIGKDRIDIPLFCEQYVSSVYNDEVSLIICPKSFGIEDSDFKSLRKLSSSFKKLYDNCYVVTYQGVYLVVYVENNKIVGLFSVGYLLYDSIKIINKYNRKVFCFSNNEIVIPTINNNIAEKLRICYTF